jgi:hypothetical protein
MKTIYLLHMTLIVFSVSIFAQTDEYQGMAGTERPVFHESSETRKCYVFNEYVIKTNQPSGEGDDISVYKRVASTGSKNACRTTGKAYLFIKDSDNNSFFGIAGNFLFVDSGTSVESRGLEVYDLTSRRRVVADSYSETIKLVGDRFVVYDAPSDKKGPIKTCKEAAKWKREGGSVGWVQGKKLDLQTLKQVNTGPLHCVYVQ